MILYMKPNRYFLGTIIAGTMTAKDSVLASFSLTEDFAGRAMIVAILMNDLNRLVIKKM